MQLSAVSAGRGPAEKELKPVEHLLTEALLREYIAALRQRTAQQTVVTQVRSLSSGNCRAMAPEADRSLLKLAITG